MRSFLIGLICLISTHLFATNTVTLAWDAILDSNVIGVKIYWGFTSHSYTKSFTMDYAKYGVTNRCSITDDFGTNGTLVYFAATTYDASNESDFSNEVVWTNPYPNTVIITNLTYVGVKVDYGTNLFNLLSRRVMVMAVTNNPKYYYSESLILTNNPISGIRPSDTNKYVYIGTLIRYGSSLTNLQTLRTDLFTLTNPPNYFYRSSLILTNNPF